MVGGLRGYHYIPAFTHPVAPRHPCLVGFFILGEPQNKTAAPLRGQRLRQRRGI
jgi:hypothetical protein